MGHFRRKGGIFAQNRPKWGFFETFAQKGVFSKFSLEKGHFRRKWGYFRIFRQNGGFCTKRGIFAKNGVFSLKKGYFAQNGGIFARMVFSSNIGYFQSFRSVRGIFDPNGVFSKFSPKMGVFSDFSPEKGH